MKELLLSPQAGSGMPWQAASQGITGVDTKEKFGIQGSSWEPQLTTNRVPVPESKVHKERRKWVP